MTPAQAEARKRNFYENRIYQYKTNENSKRAGTFFHQRGYDKGDIRCCICGKWLNPDDPHEAIEIQYGLGGHRTHKEGYCTSAHSYGPANFIMFPRDGPGRRKRHGELKRY